MTRSPVEVCESKRWYGTELLAARAADLVWLAFRKAQEPYECPTCRTWHLRTIRDHTSPQDLDTPWSAAHKENA